MIIKIIEPNSQSTKYDVRSLTPNLGPVVIASLLKQQGHKVEVISEYITQLNFREIQKADLVGISITTYNAKRGYEIAQRLKKPVVFGLSLIHISEPTRQLASSRMPSSA